MKLYLSLLNRTYNYIQGVPKNIVALTMFQFVFKVYIFEIFVTFPADRLKPKRGS